MYQKLSKYDAHHFGFGVQHSVYPVLSVLQTNGPSKKSFSDKLRTRLISQAVKGTSNVFRKNSVKYFNGIAISTYFVPATLVLPVNFDLNLNDSESIIVLLDKSLRNLHNVFVVYEKLSPYSIRLCITITTLIRLALCTGLFFISPIEVSNQDRTSLLLLLLLHFLLLQQLKQFFYQVYIHHYNHVDSDFLGFVYFLSR